MLAGQRRRRFRMPTSALVLPVVLLVFSFLCSEFRLLPNITTFAAPPQLPPQEKPTADVLMRGLGRELWVVGDELLSASSRIQVPGSQSLGQVGIAVRNAADLMLDGLWEDVQGEMETASLACAFWLPTEHWQGLIDLFGYEEAVPEVAWSKARLSLGRLSDSLDGISEDLLRGLSEGSDACQLVRSSLTLSVDKLWDARDLFEGNTFYMPPDPRDSRYRAGEGAPRTPEQRPWGDAREREAKNRAQAEEYWGRQRYEGDAARAEAWADARAAGQESLDMLQEAEEEIYAAEEGKEQNQVLRRLLIKYHPDQNKGQERETRPVFEYVRALRAQLS